MAAVSCSRSLIDKLIDDEGHEVFRNSPRVVRQVVSESTARLMISALKRVVSTTARPPRRFSSIIPWQAKPALRRCPVPAVTSTSQVRGILYGLSSGRPCGALHRVVLVGLKPPLVLRRAIRLPDFSSDCRTLRQISGAEARHYPSGRHANGQRRNKPFREHSTTLLNVLCSLKQLINELSPTRVEGPVDQEISGITYDSRRVTPGMVFVAIPGQNFDGHDFIYTAIDRGASAVICEQNGFTPLRATKIKVPDVREALARAARRLLRASEREAAR